MNENNNDPKLTEALHAAYPSQEPGDDLQHRLADAERGARIREGRPRGGGMRKGWLVMLGGLAVLSALGFTIYNVFFNRAGEAAIALIPSDADIVITLDTHPSPQQLATFEKIGAALEQEGVMQKLDDLMTMTLDQNPVAKEIRPHVSKNIAFALWMPEGGFEGPNQPDGAMFFALTNAGAVSGALDRHLPREIADGHSTYTIPGMGVCSVVGDYLVFAPNARVIDGIRAVQNGDRESVAQLGSYQSARSALAEDANLMFFMSPEALTAIDKEAKNSGFAPFGGVDWLAWGGAVREEGLEFTYHCPVDVSKVPALRHLAEIEPIDPQILRKLPGGAYGVLAYSEPAKYWEFFKETAVTDPKAKSEMEKGLAEFENKTGMSIPRDIIPAFDGNLVLAIYPSPSMGFDSGDGILILDDANGANPAATAAKVRALIERESAKDGKPVQFVETQVAGATVWKLDPKAEKEMRASIGSSSMPTVMPSPEMPAFPEGMEDMSPEEQERAIEKAMEEFEAAQQAPEPGKTNQVNPAVKDKTIIYAQVGNAVVLASSEVMLSKALDAYNGRGQSLLDEPAYATMSGRLTKDTQSIMMVNLHRVMQAVRSHLEQSGQTNVDDIVNLFGGPATGLLATGDYDGKIARGEMFIPLDYVRLIRLIGQGGKGSQHKLTLKTAPQVALSVGRASRILAKL